MKEVKVASALNIKTYPDTCPILSFKFGVWEKTNS